MGNKKLGVIELKPKRKFCDYKAKYNNDAKTKHIIPVNLSKNYNKVNQIVLKHKNCLNAKVLLGLILNFIKISFIY